MEINWRNMASPDHLRRYRVDNMEVLGYSNEQIIENMIHALWKFEDIETDSVIEIIYPETLAGFYKATIEMLPSVSVSSLPSPPAEVPRGAVYSSVKIVDKCQCLNCTGGV